MSSPWQKSPRTWLGIAVLILTIPDRQRGLAPHHVRKGDVEAARERGRAASSGSTGAAQRHHRRGRHPGRRRGPERVRRPAGCRPGAVRADVTAVLPLRTRSAAGASLGRPARAEREWRDHRQPPDRRCWHFYGPIQLAFGRYRRPRGCSLDGGNYAAASGDRHVWGLLVIAETASSTRASAPARQSPQPAVSAPAALGRRTSRREARTAGRRVTRRRGETSP